MVAGVRVRAAHPGLEGPQGAAQALEWAECGPGEQGRGARWLEACLPWWRASASYQEHRGATAQLKQGNHRWR